MIVAQFFLAFGAWKKIRSVRMGEAYFFTGNFSRTPVVFEPILPLLTDDITLAQAFSRVGGRAVLGAALGTSSSGKPRLA